MKKTIREKIIDNAKKSHKLYWKLKEIEERKKLSKYKLIPGSKMYEE